MLGYKQHIMLDCLQSLGGKNPLSDYSKPHEVSDLMIAFPATLGELLPPYELTRDWEKTPEAAPFLKAVQTWFYAGLSPESEFDLKDDIDGELMLRHLKCVLGSFEPKHEHKMAGAAYLLAQWCHSVTAVPAKKVGA